MSRQGSLVAPRVAGWHCRRAGPARAGDRSCHAGWAPILAKELPEQFKAVRAALAAQGVPARPEQVAAQFVRVRRDRVAEVLETLVSLGQARQAGRGLYAA